MSEDLNKQLPLGNIIRQTYGGVLSNAKSYIILAYLIAVPLVVVQFFVPLDISSTQLFSTNLFINLIASLLLIIVLSIFLYRLFILGPTQQFKISTKQLGEMFSNSLLYTMALVAVIILAILSVGLLFGLVLSIITSAAALGEGGNAISALVPFVLMIFVLLIIFRTQPTFISIALGQDTLPMKSAYYYTRNNNWNLILIGVSCYLPVFLFSLLIFNFVGNSETGPTTFTMALSLILAPLNMLSYALQLSAGAEIYKYLVHDHVEHDVDIRT